MGLLTGKTALITGAARGIGKAIALKFAEEGANIAFTDLVIDDNGKETEKEIQKIGVKCKGYASNAADFAQTEDVVKLVKEEFGSIDILVNNAGITRDALVLSMKEEDFQKVIDTNLNGAFYMIKNTYHAFMKRRKGRIINISSISGVMGNAGQANYAAAKAGLIGMTKSVAKELAGRGITCNAIAPGFIQTDMTAVLSDKVKAAVQEQIPMKKMGLVDDVAAAVSFFAGEESGYITGQVLCIDGGLSM